MDLSLIAQASSSVSAAVTLTKSLVGLRDEAQRLAQGNELLTELNMAHGKINALLVAEAQRTIEHQAAEREIADLKEELRAVMAEKCDFERYALQQLAPGVLAYALREAHRGAEEPTHYLCAHCRHEGKKSILQRVEDVQSVFHRCPRCKNSALEHSKPAPVPAPTKLPWYRNEW